jgi:dTDP-4-amino-4,6-dideoxygalactose transaminase
MPDTKLAIHGGTPVRKRPLPGGKKVGKEELKELIDVIDSGDMFRYSGTKVKAFEEEFRQLMGADYATASTSGTSAIHVAVGMVNPSPGDEIITAPITDIGTVIPILYQTAIPIFADVDPETFCLDPADAERKITKKTKAIIVVHLAGNPCDMDALLEIGKRHGIAIIEDCSQSHLSEYKGRPVGTIGDIGCFSLQQSKHITTGDGGITITSNEEYGIRGKLFADKGWHREEFGPRRYTLMGPNYRMSELVGAVALAQVRKLPDIVARRRANGDLLSSLIADAPGIEPQRLLDGCKHTYWHYELGVHRGGPYTADEFCQALRAEGIGCSAHYIGKPIFLCHEALAQKRIFGDSHFPFDHPNARPGIEYKEGDCPVCEDVLDRMVILSMSEFYAEADVRDVAAAVNKVAAGLSCGR